MDQQDSTQKFEPVDDDHGDRLRITRESLAAFTVALCGAFRISPDNIKALIGTWFIVQGANEAMTEAPDLPELAKKGTMNYCWGVLMSLTLNLMCKIRKGIDVDLDTCKDQLVVETRRVQSAVALAIDEITVKGRYDLAATAAKSRCLLLPRLDIENFRMVDGVRRPPYIQDIIRADQRLRNIEARRRRRKK